MSYQNKSWSKYHFNQSSIVKKQDALRSEIFNNYNSKDIYVIGNFGIEIKKF